MYKGVLRGMNIKNILQDSISERARFNVGQQLNSVSKEFQQRKKLLENRQAIVIKSNATCRISTINENPESVHVSYIVQFKDLLKQKDQLFIEEYEEERMAIIQAGQIVSDIYISQINEETEDFQNQLNDSFPSDRTVFEYDRRAAIRYAEQWWDAYNPKYKKFEVDCTNFVSQCLHAGGARMVGYPNRNKGWWMTDNSWSYSWSVAHAFRWYLGSTKTGLRSVEKSNVKELMFGDVICYDFQGDGRYDHTTLIVAKDANDMPLVNAHSSNSRMRYWSYEDSTAYTPNIKYKFFHIVDDQS